MKKRSFSMIIALLFLITATWGQMDMRNGDMVVNAAGTAMKFDFGPGSTESGFTQVLKSTAYNSSLGYGFADVTGLDSRDRGTSDALKEDFVFKSSPYGSYTFNVDVPNGDYNIRIIIGDELAGQSGMDVSVEGQLELDNVSSTSADYIDQTIEVTTVDGQLNITFDSTVTARINGIEIDEVEDTSIHHQFDMGPGSVETGFTQVLKSTGYNTSLGYGFEDTSVLDSRDRDTTDALTEDFIFKSSPYGTYTFNVDVPNGYYDVRVVIGDAVAGQSGMDVLLEGQLALDNVSTSASGFIDQTVGVTVVDGQLNISFDASTTARINAIEVQEGVVIGPEIDQYDMGNGTVETGYTQVTSATAYDAVTGFGWISTSGLNDNDRTSPDALREDFVSKSDDFSFKRDLDNGIYYVKIIVGDNTASVNPFNVNAEGVWAGAVFNQLSQGTFKEIVFQVPVNDGDLVIDFEGTNAMPVCAIEISDTAFDQVSYLYDMGNAVPRGGYAEVTATTAYSAGSGYGWSSTSGLDVRDRERPDSLRGDFVFSATDMTFKQDVANGTYRVKVLLGDAEATNGATSIHAEGILEATSDATATGHFTEEEFLATVSDGTLNLQFSSASTVRVNGIEIYASNANEAIDNPPVVGIGTLAAVNMNYGGKWTLLEDIDGDGVVEIISSRDGVNNRSHGDHYVETIVAQELDGTVIWTYGTSGNGYSDLYSDMGLQIYDWDEDGTKEVLALTRDSAGTTGYLKVFDASDGTIERTLTLPDVKATDQLLLCELGTGTKKDIIVKDRYLNLWAYDYDWNQLWHVDLSNDTYTKHSSTPTATVHYPLALDVTGDGNDEIFIGNWAFNPDGTQRFKLNPDAQDHADSVSVLVDGNGIPADYRIAASFGNEGTICFDGNGTQYWHVTGGHHQTAFADEYLPTSTGKELYIRAGSPNNFVIDKDTGEVLYTAAVKSIISAIEWDNDGVMDGYSGDYDGSMVMVSSIGSVMAKLDREDLSYKNLITRRKDKHDTNFYCDIDDDGRTDLVILMVDANGDYHVAVWYNTDGTVYTNSVQGTGSSFTGY